MRDVCEAGGHPAQIGPWVIDTVHSVDCVVGLKDIPSDSFDLVVTSPPYWGQRGFGPLCQYEVRHLSHRN